MMWMPCRQRPAHRPGSGLRCAGLAAGRLLPVAAVWFILFETLFLLYDDLEKAFRLEEQIAEQFPDQPVRRD